MLENIPFFLLSLLFIETSKLPVKVYESVVNLVILVMSVIFFYITVLLFNKPKIVGLVSTTFFWLVLIVLKNKYIST